MGCVFFFPCPLAYDKINPYGDQDEIEQDPKHEGFLALMQF